MRAALWKHLWHAKLCDTNEVLLTVGHAQRWAEVHFCDVHYVSSGCRAVVAQSIMVWYSGGEEGGREGGRERERCVGMYVILEGQTEAGKSAEGVA